MGLKHAIHTLVHRDAPPGHETSTGPAKTNESFKSIRNFVNVFVHRNDAVAPGEHDTDQDALTHHDLRRFPGGYQIVNVDDFEDQRPVSQPNTNTFGFKQGNNGKRGFSLEAPEEGYELHEVDFQARERKKPISL